MAETKTYTPQGFKALKDELDYLVKVRVEENNKGCSYLVFDTLKAFIFSDQGTESAKALI